MKRTTLIIIALFAFSHFGFSQQTGQLIYGPEAESSQELQVFPVEYNGSNTVVYSETSGAVSGFDPRPYEGDAPIAPLGEQFTAFVSNSTANSFTVTVANAPDCQGTYTVTCSPLAGSGPGGTTPPLTTIIAYIGFPQGNFFFGNAGDGQYVINVTNTNANCTPPTNPITFRAWNSNTNPYVPVIAEVTELQVPSQYYLHPDYMPNGQFRVTVTNPGSCTGTYTVFAYPVAGSGPNGTTPPMTTIVGYIGFPAGNFFLFANAGYGQYEVTVTQTNPNTVCIYTGNPLVFTVDIVDPRVTIPISNYAIVLGIALIVLIAVIRFRRIL